MAHISFVSENNYLCRVYSPPKYWGQMVYLMDATSSVSALVLVLDLQEQQECGGKEDPVWLGSPVKET